MASVSVSINSVRGTGSSIEYPPSPPSTDLGEPETPTTPDILDQADRLRYALEEVMETIVHTDDDPNTLLDPLAEEFTHPDVWEAALRSPLPNSDIPVVEGSKRGLHRLVEAILVNSFPFSERERHCLLEAPGRYGLTALQHAVRFEQWQAANILVRYGANIGHNGDNLRIVQSLLRAARLQRRETGSWRGMDRGLTDLLATINMVRGENWATDSPPPPAEHSVTSLSCSQPGSLLHERRISVTTNQSNCTEESRQHLNRLQSIQSNQTHGSATFAIPEHAT